MELSELETIVETAIKETSPCGKSPKDLVAYIISILEKECAKTYAGRMGLAAAKSSMFSESILTKEMRRVELALNRLVTNATFLAVCDGKSPFNTPEIRTNRLKIFILDAIFSEATKDSWVFGMSQQWKTAHPETSFGGRRTRRSKKSKRSNRQSRRR